MWKLFAGMARFPSATLMVVWGDEKFKMDTGVGGRAEFLVGVLMYEHIRGIIFYLTHGSGMIKVFARPWT